MADKKIKEIYGCDNNKTRGDTLVDWYNEIIEKTEIISVFISLDFLYIYDVWGILDIYDIYDI